MYLTNEQKACFDRDGYVIVSGIFDPEQIEAARRETELITYGKSFEEFLAEYESASSAEPAKIEPGQGQFPVGKPALDSLLETDGYVQCFKDCLNTDDLSFLLSQLFVRSGPVDKRFAPQPWQGYHIDDNTCSSLPPHPDVDRYQYINSWVMLHDIEEDGAPLHVLPGSHRQLAELLPRLTQAGDAIRGNFRDIREVPEFAPAVKVTGKAGETLFYSSQLVHAAVGFENKRRQRALWTMSFANAANDSWTRFRPFDERDPLLPFWAKTTTEVRSAFGWPLPGDPYYTPETLELLTVWFPGIDLSSYR